MVGLGRIVRRGGSYGCSPRSRSSRSSPRLRGAAQRRSRSGPSAASRCSSSVVAISPPPPRRASSSSATRWRSSFATIPRNRFTKVDNLWKCVKLRHLDLGFNHLRTISLLSEVSSAVHRLSERCSQEAHKLQLHMSSMQQASDNAKKEWISFIKKGESRYQEDISSSVRLRNNMENVLHQWRFGIILGRSCLGQQRLNVQSRVNGLLMGDIS